MRRLSIFGHGVHPCAWAAIVFAVSPVTAAGIGMVTDGGGFFIYGIPVSGIAAVAAWIASAAGMAGAVLFVATYATVSIVRSFREGQVQPRGFAVVVPRSGRPGQAESGATKARSPGVFAPNHWTSRKVNTATGAVAELIAPQGGPVSPRTRGLPAFIHPIITRRLS